METKSQVMKELEERFNQELSETQIDNECTDENFDWDNLKWEDLRHDESASSNPQLDFYYDWHYCDEFGSPLSDYEGLDWVLVQFAEFESGRLLIPTVAEFRGNRWWFDSPEKNKTNYHKNLKALAWVPLPEYLDEDK